MQPDEFISVAEESGLMVELGHWIIKQALGQFHQLTKMLGDDVLPTLSINISVFQLQDRELVPLLETQLAKYQLHPEQITLEITESALIEHSRHEHHTIELLSDAGFTIAIDDFGTGYASFRHLQQLPISMVKIDRSFVTGVDQDKVKGTSKNPLKNFQKNIFFKYPRQRSKFYHLY